MKAQGLSLNVIIVAAIGLVVLVVLIMLFGGKIREWTGNSKDCYSLGGECKPGNEITPNCGKDFAYKKGGTCPANNICCIRVNEEIT